MTDPEIKFRTAPDGTEIRHRESSCGSKIGYKTERAAWFGLRAKRRNGESRDNAGVYQCVRCWLWHIGRKPEGGT